MFQYNNVNAKSSNSQLNKLKSTTKTSAEVTVRLSSKVNGESNDETNFLELVRISIIFA